MAEQLERVDELHRILVAARDPEGEKRACALGHDHLGEVVIGRGFQPRIGHDLDPRVLFQIFGDDLGILDMALHAERKRLDPQQRVMRALRVSSSCRDRARPTAMEWKVKAMPPSAPWEIQAVIGGLGAARLGYLPEARPVELARIDDDAAGHRAVAGEVLGGGMDDERGHARWGDRDRGWPWCCRRSAAARDVQPRGRSHRGPRSHRPGCRSSRSRTGRRVVVDRCRDGLGIVKVHQLRRPAELADGVVELLDGAAIELGRGHHVRAGFASAGTAP